MKLLITILAAFTFFMFVQDKSTTGKEKQLNVKRDTSSAWTAPESASRIKNPLSRIVNATHKGENLFVQNCTECHGMTGKGDGPTADMLDTKPANLTSAKVQKESDGALFWKITEGKGAMASYKNVFSEEQRWQLVNYIRKLGKDNVKQKNK